MTVSFTPPEKSNVFYGKSMHEEFCGLCDKKGIPPEARQEYAETMGFGFGYAYMCKLEKLLKSRNFDQADGERYSFSEAANSSASLVTQSVTDTMTFYLVEHGGKVDCWPSPYYADAFTFALTSTRHERHYSEEVEDWIEEDAKEVTGHFTLPFNFFGGKYIQHVKTTTDTSGSGYSTKVSDTVKSFRVDQEPGLTRRSAFVYPELTGEYKALSQKHYQLEQTYEKAYQKRHAKKKNLVKEFFIRLPALLTILIALLGLFWTFTGTDGLEDAINQGAFLTMLNNAAAGDGIRKILAFIPATFVKIAAFCWYMASLIGCMIRMEKIAVIVCMLLLVIGGLYLSVMIEDACGSSESGIERKAWAEAQAAKKEAKKIEASPRYQKLRAEHNKLREEYTAFAQTWLDAWFEACEKINP